MRKRWLFIPLLLVVVALAVTGGTVLAQDQPSDETTPPKATFISRLAQNLGLDEATVRDAVQQTVREMEDERVKHRLDRLVEAGRLTQEEADEIYAWFQARPDAVVGHGPWFRKGPRHGHFDGRMMGPQGMPGLVGAPHDMAGPGLGFMGRGLQR